MILQASLLLIESITSRASEVLVSCQDLPGCVVEVAENRRGRGPLQFKIRVVRAAMQQILNVWFLRRLRDALSRRGFPELLERANEKVNSTGLRMMKDVVLRTVAAQTKCRKQRRHSSS